MMRRVMGMLALWLCVQTAAWAASARVDGALEARVNALSEKLRCLVCQNQSIAESQADLANDLRRQVREQLAAGKSEQDVVDFLVARYGDFVLYDPPMRTSTLLLWLGPAVLMLGAMGGFLLLLRRRRTVAVAAADTQALARARALLEQGSKERSQ